MDERQFKGTGHSSARKYLLAPPLIRHGLKRKRSSVDHKLQPQQWRKGNSEEQIIAWIVSLGLGEGDLEPPV